MKFSPAPYSLNNIRFILSWFLLAVANLILSSCNSTSRKENKPEKKKYSIYILGKNHQEYIIQTDDLTKGELKPESDGVELNTQYMDRDVIVKNGYYYHLDRKTATFSKYIKTDNAFFAVAELKIDNFSVENFYWLSPDTLLLTGLDNKDFVDASFYKIAVKNFTIAQTGKLPVPKPPKGYESSSIGVTTILNHQLFLAYTYHKHFGPASYTTSDTIYTVSLSYPSMRVDTVAIDTRSSYPAGINTIQSYSFFTENGDFYFMSCPGIALGNTVKRPTAIFKIKKGESTISKDYFFNISASKINNHAYGIWYIGNGKAIIRSERKDLYKDFSEHAFAAQFEFYLLDLTKQSVTKLNLPLDKGTRREAVIVEKDTVYISINSSTVGNYIWLYDIRSGKLKKGLKLSGDTDYIYRIDKNF